MAALTRAGAGKTTEAENSYVIRPSYKKKFPVGRVKEIMLAVMREKLADSKYDTELSAVISHDIREKLKALDLPRYKFMVQVVMGEQKGEGVRMGCRAFWDNETDNYASETYSNDEIFCVAAAFAVYLY